MKSGEKKLDANMQKALKADENPNILFHMTRYQTVLSTSNAQGFTIKASGTLNVAGVEKPIELEANATAGDNGVRIQGSKDVLMTDHGVKPPVILILKTRDKVVIHFDLNIGL
jgi:polyisoprenoid-binding protein YceI